MGNPMGKTNEENFEEYKARMANSRGELTPPPNLTLDKLMDHLAKEGEKLLAEEPKPKKVKKDDTKKLDKALAISSKNPYIRARVQILEKMLKWKREEIHMFERTGNINNRFYDDFVHEVRKLGDILDKQQ